MQANNATKETNEGEPSITLSSLGPTLGHNQRLNNKP